MKSAREEAEMVLFECVREVLAACKLKPRQVRRPLPLGMRLSIPVLLDAFTASLLC